ncbi:MAG: hypothetical protein V3U20_06075 [Thermoplasmata archaeon]
MSEVFGLDFEIIDIHCDKEYYKKTGREWLENAFQICKDESDGTLFGAVGPTKKRPLEKPNVSSSMLFVLRFGFGSICKCATYKALSERAP